MSGPALSIKTPGTLWAKALEQIAAASKKPEGRGDAYVYFIGGRGSGKSTLLNRFLYPTRVEVPKPSEGVEYTYARKPAAYDHERKDLAHIWELGGSQEFMEEVMTADQLFLTFKQVTTAVVVVVVDLSDPAAALASAVFWLDQVKKKLASSYEKFEKKGHQLPEQLRQRAKVKLYSGNEDKDTVWHSGISLVLAATKYDAFRNEDPEVKKVMARCLRYVAHAHGAFLTYLSGLQASGSGGDAREAALEASLLDNFTRLMNHLIFTGLEKKPALKLNPMLDHNGPLMVPAGADRFKDIGRPRGGGGGADAQGLSEWKDLFDKTFPGAREREAKMNTKGGGAAKFNIPEQYHEEEVDLARARRLGELDSYRKDVAAAAEATKKKALMAKLQQQQQQMEATKKKQNASYSSSSGHLRKSTSSAAKA